VTLESLKQAVCGTIDSLREELVSVSHAIHQNPELAFEETFASGLLGSTLAKHGLSAERGAYGLETAYATNFGRSAGPSISSNCPLSDILKNTHIAANTMAMLTGTSK
jgi:metal-dependent amidase/aminoacylase/carboxypeptidase family protein